MTTHFINIKRLYSTFPKEVSRLEGADMATMPFLDQAFISVKNGYITAIGEMKHWKNTTDEIIDLQNQNVAPTFCDSHTHIIFAEPREKEFEMKIKGMTYEEIAAAGGGILQSALKLQECREDDLYRKARTRLIEVIEMGTGAIEIKSGYGLTIEAELKMLRIIQRLKQEFDIPIKATFLGAHAIPLQFKANPNQYIDEVILPLIPIIAKDKLADYIDIFIEKNYFSLEQSDKILKEAAKYGLKPKLHVNQLSNSGGVQLGVEHQAISLDHLEEIAQAEIDCLKAQKTIATLLPSCSFFIKIPFAPARDMIDQGLGIALASDYNPGSTPSGNMNFVQSLACIYMKLTPAEAFNAATINGAYAMECHREVGSITMGKRANFFTFASESSLASIPYSFGRPIVERVYISGKLFETSKNQI